MNRDDDGRGQGGWPTTPGEPPPSYGQGYSTNPLAPQPQGYPQHPQQGYPQHPQQGYPPAPAPYGYPPQQPQGSHPAPGQSFAVQPVTGQPQIVIVQQQQQQQQQQQAAVVVKAPFNHGLHAVITLLTCGAWLPVWIILAILH